MPDEYVFTGASMNSFSSANSTISSKRSVISRFVRPSMMPLMKTFSRPEISGWKPAPSSISAEMRPSHRHRAARRLGDAGDELQQRALAGAVAADDAERAPLRHRQRDVVQRRERLVGLQVLDEAARQQRALQRRELLAPAVAAVDLRDVRDLDARAASHLLRERVAQPIEQPVARRGTAPTEPRRARAATSSGRTGRRRTGSPDTRSRGA